MDYYKVVCACCRSSFTVTPGTMNYKQFKNNRKGKFICEDCQENIRMEAIKNLFG